MIDPARFWAKVEKIPFHTCWEWTASVGSHGYGQIGTNRERCKVAHRVSWELANGPIPEGLWVLHTCDNKTCVRPEHLYLGSAHDNNRDARERGQSPQCVSNGQCQKGHRYDTMHGGRPRCKTCLRRTVNRWRDRTGRVTGQRALRGER